MEFIRLNNCDEVLKFLVENYDQPYVGFVEFQGNEVECCGMPSQADFIVVSKEYLNTIFLISYPVDGKFELQIIIDFASTDELPTIILPEYAYNEMICTIKGLQL